MKLLHDDVDTSESILFSLVVALEAKDFYTKGHSERVADIAVGIGKTMSLPEHRSTPSKRKPHTRYRKDRGQGVDPPKTGKAHRRGDVPLKATRDSGSIYVIH